MSGKNSINFIAGMVFTLLWGIPAHFAYGWFGQDSFAGLFFPVNESVWEHLKLLFYPVVLYTSFEMVVLCKCSLHFLTVRLIGLLAGLLLIPTLFFIYAGFIGCHFFLFDILIYLCGIFLTFFLSRFLEVRKASLRLPGFVLFVLLLFLVILFFSFTFVPPSLPMFRESFPTQS